MPREVKTIARELEHQPGVRNKWAVAWSIYKRRQQARLVKKYREKNSK